MPRDPAELRCFQVHFAFSASRPSQPACAQGAGRGDLPRNPSTGRPVCASFFGEERETENAQQSKKKIMKTYTNSDSELKNRTAQSIVEAKPELPKAELPKIDFVKRRRNRSLPTERLLALLQREAPRLWELAEVVGKWVWVQFDGQQPPQVTAELSQFGFHWNNRRQVWQHPCGQMTDSTNYDPRRRYGSFFPADQQPV